MVFVPWASLKLALRLKFFDSNSWCSPAVSSFPWRQGKRPQSDIRTYLRSTGIG